MNLCNSCSCAVKIYHSNVAHIIKAFHNRAFTSSYEAAQDFIMGPWKNNTPEGLWLLLMCLCVRVCVSSFCGCVHVHVSVFSPCVDVNTFVCLFLTCVSVCVCVFMCIYVCVVPLRHNLEGVRLAAAPPACVCIGVLAGRGVSEFTCCAWEFTPWPWRQPPRLSFKLQCVCVCVCVYLYV